MTLIALQFLHGNQGMCGAFQQGPGATLMFIDAATGKTIGTDATQLGLHMVPFETNKGATPLLAAKIAEVLKAFGK